MKQLTRVVEGGPRRGDGEGAGGQQHLGQHGRADRPQMVHSQLADITQPELGQDLTCGGTLRHRHSVSSMAVKS